MSLIDFSLAAAQFARQGWIAEEWAEQAWRYAPPAHEPARLRLLVSVGVHGDETAPIEMLAGLLPRWARKARALRTELLVCVGNPEAVAAGRRHLQHDMNRLFGATDAPDTAEARRARVLREAAQRFLARAGTPALHLDLHTTIRPSLRETFAVIPSAVPAGAHGRLLGWLAQAGLEAALLNPLPGSTFSACTAGFGAAACTVELGRVGRIGENRMDVLRRFEAALDELVRSGSCAAGERASLEVYRVSRELLRSDASFRLLIPDDTPNFHRFSAGDAIAEDERGVIRAQTGRERIVFPNARVAVGLRAGLLVVPQGAEP